jgi:hypothetical protein
MENFFRTHAGRSSLVLGGIDLALLGIASLVEEPQLTALLLAVVPMLSLSVGIYIVVYATFEIGGLFPIGLFSILLFLLGVYAFGLTNATLAGPAAGAMSLSVGVLFALLGGWPAELALERRIERTV